MECAGGMAAALGLWALMTAREHKKMSDEATL